jgi:hypothetical protein
MILIGTPHTKGAGYFVNDKDLRTRQEADVQTCAHCQRILLMQKWKEEGGWCAREMKPLCLPCADRALMFGCEPWMKQLEDFMESQMRFKKLRITRTDTPAAPQSIITGNP